jgi:transposase
MKVEQDDLRSEILKLKENNIRLENEVILLKEENLMLHQKVFGRKSEKRKPVDEGPSLFNEAEATADAEEAAKPEQETITYTRDKPQKPGRKPLSDTLPREVVVNDLSDEEKVCPCCGETLERLCEESDDVSERLKYIPAKLVVVQTRTPKYVCRKCHADGEGEKSGILRQAPAAPSIIPRGIATPELLAFILTQKFCYAAPYYRLESQFASIGAAVSRQDMSNWQIMAGKALKPLDKLLVEAIRAGPVQRHDETRVQVLGTEGKSDTSNSWVWLARGGPPERPVVRYKYSPSRAHGNVAEYTQGYTGFVQTDGYPAYDCEFAGNAGITHVGCFAHARRKFVEAEKNGAEQKSAAIALNHIGKLYALENKLRKELADGEICAAEFVEKRKNAAEDILRKFKKWLDDRSKTVNSATLFGKAVSYSCNQWDKLTAYLGSEYLTPDNNASENAIRPFVIGRKNWLFFQCPSGAESGCLFYSLIETAKLNGLDPLGYLTKVLSRAPTTADWDSLMPWNLK